MDAELPPMNVALEEMRARVGSYDPDDQGRMLVAWIQLGVEALARELGREAATGLVDQLGIWIRAAKPSQPWKP